MSEISRRQTLTSFVPRQVMLETAAATAATAADTAATAEDTAATAADTAPEKTYKKKKKRKDGPVSVMEVEEEEKKSKKKKKKSSSHTSDAADRPSGDSFLLKGNGREDLLKSIAAFLESSGFGRTLSVFLSEAQLEVADSIGGSCFNLEDLFDKFIELSKRDPVAIIDCSKEQGRLIVDAANDSSVVTIDKKGKRKGISDSQVEKDPAKSQRDSSIGTAGNTDDAKYQNKEKKKKQKVELGEDKDKKDCLKFVKEKIEELKASTSNSNFVTDNVEKKKSEKKKKKKEANSSPEQIELEINQKMVVNKSNDGDSNASSKHQQSVNSDKSVKDLKEMIDETKKDMKKHKNENLEKSSSDNIHKISSVIVEETCDERGKHTNYGFQRLASTEEIISLSEEHTSAVEKITNKKRKRSSKETLIQAEDLTAATKPEQTKPEGTNDKEETVDHKAFANSEQSPFERKQKTAKSNGESDKLSRPLSFDELDKHEENCNLMEPRKELSGHQLENEEESTGTKSLKKQKHSGEPKTINVFQRVKIDEVRFADERLQDNSYWALDDSGTGYGAKAQEILGKVRGRDFRHEKTKKKRGTYRGGQIDLQSHSIKFNYSDDE